MTTIANVMDSLENMRRHLKEAHNMEPDFHITMTYECRNDLLKDRDAMRHMLNLGGRHPCQICGHGFTVTENQKQPYRIWIAGRLS